MKTNFQSNEIMLTDCGGNAWHNLNESAKVKLNNGYIQLQKHTQAPESIIMDYELSSDAALLDRDQQQALNRDTSILLLDVNQQQQQTQQQQQAHSNIINNPVTVNSNLTSPQHVIVAAGSLRNSISPISTSPTTATTANKSQVVVNLDYPNSMQTITTLQRNNAKNSSTNSNRSQTNSTMLTSSSIGNNIKSGDKIFKSATTANNNRKYKFNLLKLSSSPSRAERSTRNRLLIVAICLIIFGIAIGAFIVHLSGIFHCNPERIGRFTPNVLIYIHTYSFRLFFFIPSLFMF